MASIRHLSKPPITEAILDFRVRPGPDIRLEELAKAAAELSVDYPRSEEAWLVEGSFAFSTESANAVSSSSRRANGYFLHSRDGKQVGQFRLDGFTFSRLAPYTSWEDVAPEALRLWELYAALAKPETLYRIAVRYINHISLPEAPTELEQILTCAPRIPVELPQFMTGFLSRVLVPLPLANTHTSVVQAMDLPPAAPSNTLLLDVDVFCGQELPLSTDALRPLFEQLREFKNKAFFGSLKEETVRLFD